METQDDRVPVTLLTGFLGAGKTTLLNHLIRDPEAGRIAVIMNEFGDVGLDHDLIEEATEEVILMRSGCLCCTFRGDISKTLGSLMERRKHGELTFDRVVIETTGIADPGPILHTLVVDDLIAPSYRMDGVVTLADAATGTRTLKHQVEAVQQIAMADLIVVTKADLVTPSEYELFDAQLGAINGSARRVIADHGRVLTGSMFGLSALRANATSDDISAWLGMTQPRPDPSVGLCGSAPHENKPAPLLLNLIRPQARHDRRIGSVSIEVSDPIPARVFDVWLDMLMAFSGPDILRMKGIVHVEGMEWPVAFHAVQHIVDAPVPMRSWSGKDMTSRVIVIARDVDNSDLKACLESLPALLREAEMRAQGIGAETAEMPF